MGEMGLLFIRRKEKPIIDLTNIRGGIKRSSANKDEIIFVAATLLLLLIGGNLFSLFHKLGLLHEQKILWSQVVHRTPETKETLNNLKVEELPSIIDQCARILQNEDVEVPSFNLERFGEEVQSPYINFALIRFKVKGPWEGIQSGIDKIESQANQLIKVQQAHLYNGGGEILLRIYFLEPDKPLSP
jgi:hypothetical protein